MIQDHGIYFAAQYFIFNEMCVLYLTYLLHCDYLGTGDIEKVVNYIGLSKFVDVNSQLDNSFQIGLWEVSGRLVANFGIASAFMSLCTPLQIPLCVITLPYFKRIVRSAFGLRHLLRG